MSSDNRTSSRSCRTIGWRVAGWAVLVGTLGALTAGSAVAFEQRQVGSWVLKSGSAADLGPYCTVETEQDGRILALQVTKRGKLFFGFSDPRWNWIPASPHDVTVTVTDQAEWEGKAFAFTTDRMAMPIQSDPAIDPARMMEAGASLVLAVDGASTTFDLVGFSDAAKAQRGCLAAPG